MATPPARIQFLLTRLDREQQHIVLDPTLGRGTKAALLQGLEFSQTDANTLLRYASDAGDAADSGHAGHAGHAGGTPKAAEAMTDKDKADVQAVMKMLALEGGGSSTAEEPTAREVQEMESTMDKLLTALTGGDAPPLEGGGGMHDRIMRHVLGARDYNTWVRTGHIHDPTPAQRRMVAELSRGHILGPVLTPEQIVSPGRWDPGNDPAPALRGRGPAAAGGAAAPHALGHAPVLQPEPRRAAGGGSRM